VHSALLASHFEQGNTFNLGPAVVAVETDSICPTSPRRKVHLIFLDRHRSQAYIKLRRAGEFAGASSLETDLPSFEGVSWSIARLNEKLVEAK